MDINKLRDSISNQYETIIEKLKEILKYKCESPNFNPDWEEKGDLLDCLNNISNYIKEYDIKGLNNLQVINEKNITPALFFSVNSTEESETYSILFYGHIDKIPFGNIKDWKYDPNDPQVIDNKLYGRGASNGPYSIFMLLMCLKAVQEQISKNADIKLPKIYCLLDSSKESGSLDLNYYILEHLNKYIKEGGPDIIFSLESSSPSEDYFHFITSMKGHIEFDLKIQTLTRSIHSGNFGGLVPDPLMIYRNLIGRIETYSEGKIIYPEWLNAQIEEDQRKNAENLVKNLGDFYESIPVYEGLSLLGNSTLENYLNNIFNPSINIVFQEGLNSMANASGVISFYNDFRLSIKFPPTLNVGTINDNINNLFLTDPPFNASILIENIDSIQGKNIKIEESIYNSLNKSSNDIIQKDIILNGLSDGVPFINIFTENYKDTNFICSGCSDTYKSNNYSVDENLNIELFKNLTMEMALFFTDFSNYKNS